jgi:hypothetical protein
MILRRARHLYWVIALWLMGHLCLSGLADATMFAPTTLPEKVARATHIVMGTVWEIEAQDRPGGFVVTEVHLTANRVIKGFHPEESLILEIPGGRTATQTMAVPGMPQFQVGQEALFMLIEVKGQEGIFTFVPFGIYPVTSPTTLGISPSEVDQLLWEPTLPAGALPPMVPGMGGDGAVTISGVLPENPPANPVQVPRPHGGGAPPQKAKPRRIPNPAVPLFLPEGQVSLEGFLQLLSQE